MIKLAVEYFSITYLVEFFLKRLKALDLQVTRNGIQSFFRVHFLQHISLLGVHFEGFLSFFEMVAILQKSIFILKKIFIVANNITDDFILFVFIYLFLKNDWDFSNLELVFPQKVLCEWDLFYFWIMFSVNVSSVLCRPFLELCRCWWLPFKIKFEQQGIIRKKSMSGSRTQDYLATFIWNYFLIWKYQKWSLNRDTLVSATVIYQTESPFTVLSAFFVPFLFFLMLLYDSRLFPELLLQDQQLFEIN